MPIHREATFTPEALKALRDKLLPMLNWQPRSEYESRVSMPARRYLQDWVQFLGSWEKEMTTQDFNQLEDQWQHGALCALYGFSENASLEEVRFAQEDLERKASNTHYFDHLIKEGVIGGNGKITPDRYNAFRPQIVDTFEEHVILKGLKGIDVHKEVGLFEKYMSRMMLEQVSNAIERMANEVLPGKFVVDKVGIERENLLRREGMQPGSFGAFSSS